jgi:ribonucleoside-diphosphate reductase alpha chain
MTQLDKKYTRNEVEEATRRYFMALGNDEAAASLQTDVWVNKYALKDKQENYYERTPDDMHRRLAAEFARVERNYENPLSEEEIYLFLRGFEYVVPQGSPMYGIGNPFQAVSLSNCSVIASPEDTISGIFNTARDMANLYKRRFGVGTDLGSLRPAGAPVNNAAVTSTGAWSFADFYSYVTRLIGQNNRRGALMLTMPCNHMDIEQFVTMKSDLTKVTGANVSVKITDAFMAAVETDSSFTLQWPIDVPVSEAQMTREVRARDLFMLIAETAHKTAEPGLLFWDAIRRNIPLDYYPGFETISTNPCGELPLPDRDSCRLISQTLFSHVVNAFTDQSEFDWESFKRTVRIAMRLSDDLVDLELEKLEQLVGLADSEDEKDLFRGFIEKCRNGRRTGLGTHGLADLLTMLRFRYDDDDALEFIDKLYYTQKIEAYRTSVALARERGAFPMFDWEVEKACPFFADFPEDLLADMKQYGRRNGAILTNAPTGTVALMARNCSSGIEPVFKVRYVRSRKLHAGEKPDYTDLAGDSWQQYDVYHWTARKYLSVWPEEKLPRYFVAADEIDWVKRAKIQGVITKHIDHSVSNTVNLPEDVPVAVVTDLYLEAWRNGCKGVTVYRAGSRTGEVLSAAKEKPKAGVGDTGRPTRGRTTNGEMTKASFTDSTGNARKVYVYTGRNDTADLVEVFLVDEFGGPEVHAYASAMGRLVSLALKNGIPPKEVSEKLIGLRGDSQSFSGGVFTSVPDFVGKLMVKMSGESVAPKTAGGCPVCRGPLAFSEGCKKCTACGWGGC